MMRSLLSLVMVFSSLSAFAVGQERELGELLCGNKIEIFHYRKTAPGTKPGDFKVAVQRLDDGVDLVRSDSDEPDGYQVNADKVVEERNWFTLLWKDMVVGEQRTSNKEPKGRNIAVKVRGVNENRKVLRRSYRNCVTLLVRIPGLQVEKRTYCWGVGLIRCEVYRSDEDYKAGKPSQVEELTDFK